MSDKDITAAILGALFGALTASFGSFIKHLLDVARDRRTEKQALKIAQDEIDRLKQETASLKEHLDESLAKNMELALHDETRKLLTEGVSELAIRLALKGAQKSSSLSSSPIESLHSKYVILHELRMTKRAASRRQIFLWSIAIFGIATIILLVFAVFKIPDIAMVTGLVTLSLGYVFIQFLSRDRGK